MHTSYFAKSANNQNAVSIAGKAPIWFKGRQYKVLAPGYWFFKKYKDENDEKYHDEVFYTEQYYREVLDKLNPHQVLRDLGEDAVLLCWEKSGEFCHRHLVADWLRGKLGVQISEL